MLYWKKNTENVYKFSEHAIIQALNYMSNCDSAVSAYQFML